MILAERRITILCEFIISIGLRLAKADNHIAIAVVPALPALEVLILLGYFLNFFARHFLTLIFFVS